MRQQGGAVWLAPSRLTSRLLSTHLGRHQPPGVVLLLYSMLLSHGLEKVKKALRGEALLDEHGCCDQAVVNFFLTGRPISAVRLGKEGEEGGALDYSGRPVPLP